MRKEFPFGWALTFALVVHAVLGIVLKQNPLLIAAPAPPLNASAPMKMHFVESPPAAKTVPANPNANYLSDANRKAGPLVKTEKRERRSTQYAKNLVPAPRPGGGSGQRAPARDPASEPSALPQIEQPPLKSPPPTGDYRIPSPQVDTKRLSSSLKNLDQFIGKSGQGEGQEQDSGSSEGDLPSGDPGSGVFFDTQGFDLGPWANRVVAIVRSNWIIPVAAELGVKGIVGVSFQVEKDGNIVNIKVISASGTPSFDQAAMNALKTSDPLPPLPPDFPRRVLPGIFRFYYNIAVPEK